MGPVALDRVQAAPERVRVVVADDDHVQRRQGRLHPVREPPDALVPARPGGGAPPRLGIVRLRQRPLDGGRELGRARGEADPGRLQRVQVGVGGGDHRGAGGEPLEHLGREPVPRFVAGAQGDEAHVELPGVVVPVGGGHRRQHHDVVERVEPGDVLRGGTADDREGPVRPQLGQREQQAAVDGPVAGVADQRPPQRGRQPRPGPVGARRASHPSGTTITSARRSRSASAAGPEWARTTSATSASPVASGVGGGQVAHDRELRPRAHHPDHVPPARGLHDQRRAPQAEGADRLREPALRELDVGARPAPAGVPGPARSQHDRPHPGRVRRARLPGRAAARELRRDEHHRMAAARERARQAGAAAAVGGRQHHHPAAVSRHG